MKGIVLAGGSGTRLYPITKGISKQLLPIYNKPMIYYPLSSLISAGIREILIITTPVDQPSFKRLLGSGSQWGLKFHYEIQEQPRGLADAFRVGESFIGSDSVCLVLGDNLFYGHGFSDMMEKAASSNEGATIFAYCVSNPSDYGVVEFDAQKKAINLEEKPKVPRSRYAVPGVYFYDNQVVSIAKHLKPSRRGELEITDVNREYLSRGRLKVEMMGRGTAWLDTGSYDSFQQAAQFVETVEKRQGLMIGCPEEMAFRKGFISIPQLRELALQHGKTDYARYLNQLVETQEE